MFPRCQVKKEAGLSMADKISRSQGSLSAPLAPTLIVPTGKQEVGRASKSTMSKFNEDSAHFKTKYRNRCHLAKVALCIQNTKKWHEK
jgi:hypothetical protein